MKMNKFDSSNNVIAENDESYENHRYEAPNRIHDLYDNSVKVSSKNSNLILNKLNYDDFSKNCPESNELDLEKFYEAKQKKIEEIILRKSYKTNPNMFNNKEPAKKSDIITKPSNNIRASNPTSPSYKNERPRSAYSNKISKTPAVKSNKSKVNSTKKLINGTTEERQGNMLKKSYNSSSNNEMIEPRRSQRINSRSKPPKPEIRIEIRNNRIYNVSPQTTKVQTNKTSEFSSPKSQKNGYPCMSEKRFIPNSNCISTQVNSSVNTFRKNFSTNARRKDEPKAFIQLSSLKSFNCIGVSVAPNTTKFEAPSSHSKKLDNFFAHQIQSDSRERQILQTESGDNELVSLNEKKMVLNREINDRMNSLKDKLEVIQRDKRHYKSEENDYVNTGEDINVIDQRSANEIMSGQTQPKETEEINKLKGVPQSSLTKSLVDEKYERMIRQICQRRKDSIPIEKNKMTSQDFYSKSVEWRKNILNRSMKKKADNEAEEVKGCTFTPALTESSKKYVEKIQPSGDDNIYERNVKWMNNIQKTRQLEFENKDKQELEACQFKPKTSNNLNSSEIEVVKTHHDYIYKKNINWLNKVKENRKTLELEAEMEIAKESVHLKRKNQKRNSDKGDREKIKLSLEESKAKTGESQSEKYNSPLKGKLRQNFDEDPLMEKLKTYEKDVNEIKGFFDTLKSVHSENRTITANNDVYQKRTFSSNKTTPTRKKNQEEISPNSRNHNGINRSTTEKCKTDLNEDFSYLEKYQRMVEKLKVVEETQEAPLVIHSNPEYFKTTENGSVDNKN